MDQRTLNDLQFFRIVEDAAARAQTDDGRAMVTSLSAFPDAGACAQELVLVEEAAAILSHPDVPGVEGIVRVDAEVETARKGGCLTAQELVRCARVLEVAHEARAGLSALRLRAPHLAEFALAIPDHLVVAERILQTFDADLHVREDASPRLMELRAEAAALGRRVKALVEDMLRDERVRVYLQDEYYTLREGRYVLPVRTEHRRFFGGIIHGTSQTGATVFVEPEAIVADNNQLKWVLDQIDVEEYAILKERSALVGRYGDEVLAAAGALFRLDSILARARQAAAFGGTFPRLGTDAREPLVLTDARNPLLLVLGREVVPVTVRLREPPCCLVVSGPNAGGKSVALQTIGLCVAMARHGLLPPIGAGSVLPWYDQVFTVIGDQTSVDRAVSAFTGQVERVCEVLRRPSGRCLVLLDELATGTEPRQGEALAAAIVERLVESGTECVVATHFEALKQAARERAGFENACVGVDQAGRPTYRLTAGESGQSHPFEAARAAGLPEAVIARARSLVDERERRLNEMIAEVERLREALVREKAETEALKSRVLKDKKRYESELERIRRDSDRLVHEARRETLRKIRQLEEELDRIAKETAAARTREVVRTPEVRRRVSGAREEVREKKQEVRTAMEREAPLVEDLPTEPLPAEALEVGRRVFVWPVRAEGVVVAVAADRKRAEVQVGGLRMHLKAADLRKPRDTAAAAPARTRSRSVSVSSGPDGLPASSTAADTTLDLRGMRVDEAIPTLMKRLDDACLRGEETIVVIHGMGTSALRNAVRESLRACPYPCSFRAGTREEGGEGVTVVSLLSER